MNTKALSPMLNTVIITSPFIRHHSYHPCLRENNLHFHRATQNETEHSIGKFACVYCVRRRQFLNPQHFCIKESTFVWHAKYSIFAGNNASQSLVLRHWRWVSTRENSNWEQWVDDSWTRVVNNTNWR